MRIIQKINSKVLPNTDFIINEILYKLFYNDSFIRTINNHIFDSRETLNKDMSIIENFLSDLKTTLDSNNSKNLIEILKKFSN